MIKLMNKKMIRVKRVGVKNLPILSTNLLGVYDNQKAIEKNTNENINIYVLIGVDDGRYGAMAISNGTLAARGIPSPGPIETYIRIVKINENMGLTLLARVCKPLNLATAITPSTGNTTAVMQNPNMARGMLVVTFCPKNGGNIRFPAPKNNENSIKLTRMNWVFVNFIVITSL